MVENLLDGNLNADQIRLLEEANKFDLEDFYHNKGLSSGAVCLITKNQMLMTDCFVKDSINNSYGRHFDTGKEMYKCIYGKIIEENTWERQVTGDGNILIRLCSIAPTLLFLPQKVDEKQIELFRNFVKRMSLIIKNDIDYFEENPIKILYWDYYPKNLEISINDFETCLDSLLKKEAENGKTIH